MYGLKVLLLMLLMGLKDGGGVNWNPVPRKTVPYHGETLTIYPVYPSCTWAVLTFIHLCDTLMN